jgi:hypothetical protein
MTQSNGGTANFGDASTWVHPQPLSCCHHGVPFVCKHDLKHCRICDRVYCTKCGEEWIKELKWAYTWCVGGHNYDAESESS